MNLQTFQSFITLETCGLIIAWIEIIWSNLNTLHQYFAIPFEYLTWQAITICVIFKLLFQFAQIMLILGIKKCDAKKLSWAWWIYIAHIAFCNLELFLNSPSFEMKIFNAIFIIVNLCFFIIVNQLYKKFKFLESDQSSQKIEAELQKLD